MGVYVDSLIEITPRNYRARRAGARHGQRWCHMWADTEAELHEMAAKIGMKREWYQPKKTAAPGHYDLVPTRRAAALSAGAQEMSLRDWIRKRMEEEHGRELRECSET